MKVEHLWYYGQLSSLGVNLVKHHCTYMMPLSMSRHCTAAAIHHTITRIQLQEMYSTADLPQ